MFFRRLAVLGSGARLQVRMARRLKIDLRIRSPAFEQRIRDWSSAQLLRVGCDLVVPKAMKTETHTNHLGPP